MDKATTEEQTLEMDSDPENKPASNDIKSDGSNKDVSTDTDQGEDALPTIDPAMLRSSFDTDILMSNDSKKIENLVKKTFELIEEVAEDMLDVTRRLKSIETQQHAILERFAELENQSRAESDALTQEITALRPLLTGSQKRAVTYGAFNAIVTSLDFIRAMQKGLDAEKDELVIRQLTAMELSLNSSIQGLGYQEFQIVSGDSFDPGRMECLGYEKGTPGQVTSSVRPGYTLEKDVIRPAGVLIADPELKDMGKDE